MYIFVHPENFRDRFPFRLNHFLRISCRDKTKRLEIPKGMHNFFFQKNIKIHHRVLEIYAEFFIYN